MTNGRTVCVWNWKFKAHFFLFNVQLNHKTLKSTSQMFLVICKALYNIYLKTFLFRVKVLCNKVQFSSGEQRSLTFKMTLTDAARSRNVTTCTMKALGINYSVLSSTSMCPRICDWIVRFAVRLPSVTNMPDRPRKLYTRNKSFVKSIQ